MSTFKKASIGNRGKWAEGEVQKVLDKLNEKYLRFAYERLPDARAARGALKAQLSDYLAWYQDEVGNRYSYMIEVKETEHEYRLQKDRIEQLPRLRKVAKAGGVGLVVIYHSTLDKWRGVPLSFLDGPMPPSWDLRSLPLHDTPHAAMVFGGFHVQL